MKHLFCQECGHKLIEKELKNEGMVPFCEACDTFRFPLYNVAVSMIVRNKENGKILLIQQYGRTSNVLVAGYVNRTESAEEAVVREVREETGMKVVEYRFNRTKYFAKSDTLMINFTAFVENDKDLHPNEEIDACQWFTSAEARASIRPDSLAQEFLNAYLDEVKE